MYDTAKKSRAANKAKAERLANRPLERVDSSDWTPPPLLNAGTKTGMRPVSKQALKRGGKVHGEKTKARADRVARKAGGRVEEKNEQPLVDRYINRDLKKANEYRDGVKHDGGLKRGGRAGKNEGGDVDKKYINVGGKKVEDTPEAKLKNLKKTFPNATEVTEKGHPDWKKMGYKSGGRAKKADGGMTMEEMIKKNPAPEKKSEFKMPNPVPLPPRRQEEKPKFKSKYDLTTHGMKSGGLAKLSKATKNARAKHKDGGKVADKACYGGRMKKADGGPMGSDPRMNIVKPKAMEFGQNVVVPGLKKGGRIGKAKGGSFWGSPEFQSAFKEARKSFLAGEGPKNFNFQGKSYSTDLMKVPTPPERPAPRREKVIDVKFGGSKGDMPKTDQLGNPNQGMKKGGRAAKAFGGPMMGSAPQMPAQAMANAQGRPFQGGQFTPPGLANQQPMGDVSTQVMPSIAAGAPAAMPSMPPQAAGAAMNALAGARPFARAAGGRTKGKTNINIVIAQAPKEGADQGAMPPAPPAGGPPPGIPVPVSPAGGAPMGGPMGAPPMPPPPMGAPRPTPFKKGGRVSKVAHSYKDMTAGAGSGEGRLQKTDIAERMPKKAGGKVYRSYKDMDAGAGSGFGRLEKTEIQSKKPRKG